MLLSLGTIGCTNSESDCLLSVNPIEFATPGVEKEEYHTDEKQKGNVTTTYTIPDFRVSAFRNNQWGAETLMDNVVVTRTGINSWSYSPAVNWPKDESVDFFAVSPSSILISNNQWWFHTFQYENKECDLDLLISVSKTNYQTSERIKLNFRHALARISISLKSSDSSANINVTEVNLCNVCKYGTFFFPDYTTASDTNRGEIFQCWQTYNEQENIQILKITDGNVLTLDSQPTDIGPKNIFLIPFELTSFVPGVIWEGTHIMVRYTVNEIEREARLPLKDVTPDGRWLPGRSYLYIVDIKDKNTRMGENDITCRYCLY